MLGIKDSFMYPSVHDTLPELSQIADDVPDACLPQDEKALDNLMAAVARQEDVEELDSEMSTRLFFFNHRPQKTHVVLLYLPNMTSLHSVCGRVLLTSVQQLMHANLYYFRFPGTGLKQHAAVTRLMIKSEQFSHSLCMTWLRNTYSYLALMGQHCVIISEGIGSWYAIQLLKYAARLRDDQFIKRVLVINPLDTRGLQNLELSERLEQLKLTRMLSWMSNHKSRKSFEMLINQELDGQKVFTIQEKKEIQKSINATYSNRYSLEAPAQKSHTFGEYIKSPRLTQKTFDQLRSVLRGLWRLQSTKCKTDRQLGWGLTELGSNISCICYGQSMQMFRRAFHQLNAIIKINQQYYYIEDGQQQAACLVQLLSNPEDIEGLKSFIDTGVLLVQQHRDGLSQQGLWARFSNYIIKSEGSHRSF